MSPRLHTIASGVGGTSTHSLVDADLQPAGVVLHQQRQQPVVGVLGDAPAADELGRGRRVVEDAEQHRRVRAPPVEPVAVEPERHRRCPTAPRARRGSTASIHSEHERAQLGGALRELVRAVQRATGEDPRVVGPAARCRSTAPPCRRARRRSARRRRGTTRATRAPPWRIAMRSFSCGSSAKNSAAASCSRAAQRRVDAVADDLQEAVARCTRRRSVRRSASTSARSAAGSTQRADVDGGDGVERHAAACHTPPAPSGPRERSPTVSPMEFRFLGRSGLKVSAISYGNWITHGSQVEDDAATACVHAALEAGITTFDTADVYAGTRAEVVLGNALKGQRREGAGDLHQGVLADRARPQRHGPQPQAHHGVVRGLAASARHRLRRPVPGAPLRPRDTARGDHDGLRRPGAAGKVLYIGVSEWSAEQIRAGRRAGP